MSFQGIVKTFKEVNQLLKGSDERNLKKVEIAKQNNNGKE